MAKHSTFFKQICNQIAQHLSKEISPQKSIPSQITLAKQFEVSRSTLKRVLEQLESTGLLGKKGRQTILNRSCTPQDLFQLESQESSERERVERFFLDQLASGAIPPGSQFSELQIAKAAGTTTITVREALLHLARTGLMHKKARRQWTLVKLDEKIIQESFELRFLLESHALERFYKYPSDHPLWTELKALHQAHLDLDMSGPDIPAAWLTLDAQLHDLILQAADNRFFLNFAENISALIKYQIYRPERIAERIHKSYAQHLRILELMNERKREQSISALKEHLMHGKEGILILIDKTENSTPSTQSTAS